MRVLATPSKDIDTVLSLFSRDKGAYVGYSSCEGPFYLLLTDCIRTLRQLVLVHPRLRQVKELFARGNKPLPADPGQRFMNGMVVINRQPGDTISTIALLDPDPLGGSIMLYAGWQANGESRGAPNDGCVPVPGQLLQAVVNDPQVACSFWPTVGAPRFNTIEVLTTCSPPLAESDVWVHINRFNPMPSLRVARTPVRRRNIRQGPPLRRETRFGNPSPHRLRQPEERVSISKMGREERF